MNESELSEDDILNRQIYEDSYTGENLRLNASMAYDAEMYSIRFALLEKYARGKDVLDLCCGTGSYLLPITKYVNHVTGLDYTHKFLCQLRDDAEQAGVTNFTTIEGDAGNIPVPDNSFDVVFSYTSLYSLAEPEKVVTDLTRVLKNDGTAILEFGNLRSLNTLVVAEEHRINRWAKTNNLPLTTIVNLLESLSLDVIEWRSFQALPMLSVPPKYRWLYPILTNRWKHILGVKLFGRMLDEWMCSIWPFRSIAFRHIIVVRKRKSSS